MSNQWGRDNQPKAGGSAGILLPAILCLIIIGGGAYLWFARQTMQAEIAALTESSAALNSEIIGLTTDLGKLTAEKEKLAGDLKAFRENSGDWAGELEKEFADLKLNEVPKLNRLLDKRDADISALEKELAEIRSQAARAADDYAGTISSLSGDLDTAKQTVQSLERQASDLEAQAGTLRRDRADAQDLAEKAATERDNLEAALRTQKQESDRIVSDLKAGASRTQDAGHTALQAALDAEKRKVADLQARLEIASRATVPATTRNVEPQDAEPQTPTREATVPTEPVDKTTPAVIPRSAASVETALRLTPGLGRLDAARTGSLKEKLVSGACVTDALESVFDRVPVIVMRNLMRDLKSDC